jgi:hypothetical protein
MSRGQPYELDDVVAIEVVGNPLACNAPAITPLVNVMLRGGLSKSSHLGLLSMSVVRLSSRHSAWRYRLGCR